MSGSQSPTGGQAMGGAMGVALLVLSTGLAAGFAAAGTMKLVLSRSQLALRGASWAADFGSGTVRFVGLTELVGAMGILVPVIVSIPQGWSLAAAAAGLIVVSLGAAVIHARRREPAMIVLNVALLAVVAMSVWGRSSR
ncbi:DoxX family protein [Mycobacterium sp. 050134]|uniref:DoxX family protein n=1 Tax=Mycobacterium sp. 050134 TaxID=3096111 RepID=UPI002ED79D49